MTDKTADPAVQSEERCDQIPVEPAAIDDLSEQVAEALVDSAASEELTAVDLVIGAGEPQRVGSFGFSSMASAPPAFLVPSPERFRPPGGTTSTRPCSPSHKPTPTGQDHHRWVSVAGAGAAPVLKRCGSALFSRKSAMDVLRKVVASGMTKLCLQT
jgi:hypothetical protein